MSGVPPYIRDLAKRYTAAWCNHDPEGVAESFSPIGALRINNGQWALGRHAIADVVRGVMTSFPDVEVRMDGLLAQHNHIVYHWTLSGTHTGPGGSGHRIHISGYEEWEIDVEGLIAESQAHSDTAVWRRQLHFGLPVPRFLDEDEVRDRLPLPELIDVMEKALVEFSAGRVHQPIRSVLNFGTAPSFFGVMPSYVPSLPALGAKLVTVCAGNTARGLAAHQGLIAMFDPETGAPQAILDARCLTEVRTAAVSAVSSRHLARKDSRVLGILGSGAQARSHHEALKLVHDFQEVRAWSPASDRLRQFAAETGIQAMENAEAVVRGADVIVAATTSATPVIESDWVDDGAHIIAVGACLPSQRELDPRLVARARLIVDSREAALKEAGDVVIGIAEGRWTAQHIAAELGELPARRNEREVTIFKSLGLAVEDIFAAHLVLTLAAATAE